MKYTQMLCEQCGDLFNIKYEIEQDVSDVDRCPLCGYDGPFKKQGVTKLKGKVVLVGDVKEKR